MHGQQKSKKCLRVESVVKFKKSNKYLIRYHLSGSVKKSNYTKQKGSNAIKYVSNFM